MGNIPKITDTLISTRKSLLKVFLKDKISEFSKPYLKLAI